MRASSCLTFSAALLPGFRSVDPRNRRCQGCEPVNTLAETLLLRSLLSLALAIALGVSDAVAQSELVRSREDRGVRRRRCTRSDARGENCRRQCRHRRSWWRCYGARIWGSCVRSLSKVDADTLFRVGSISKTPVWIAIMQLVEEGKLSLDDPINDRPPPALRIPDESFQKPILIRHLMTHTAGFEDSLEDLFVHHPARLLALDESLAAHRVHRVREPGTLAVYSNYGAALAGALVAHITGEPWQDYAEGHILRPLGMPTATYREPYPDSIAAARGLPQPMAAEVFAKTTNGFSGGGRLSYAAVRIRIQLRSGRRHVGKRRRYGRLHAGSP